MITYTVLMEEADTWYKYVVHGPRDSEGFARVRGKLVPFNLTWNPILAARRLKRGGKIDSVVWTYERPGFYLCVALRDDRQDSYGYFQVSHKLDLATVSFRAEANIEDVPGVGQWIAWVKDNWPRLRGVAGMMFPTDFNKLERT